MRAANARQRGSGNRSFGSQVRIRFAASASIGCRIFAHRSRVGIIPATKLRHELQEPGEAIRSLERRARPRPADRRPPGDSLFRKADRQAQRVQARRTPRPDTRAPVARAASDRGRTSASRNTRRRRGQANAAAARRRRFPAHARSCSRIFAMDAGERELRKSACGRRIHVRVGRL